jgi:hypothetical protein
MRASKRAAVNRVNEFALHRAIFAKVAQVFLAKLIFACLTAGAVFHRSVFTLSRLMAVRGSRTFAFFGHR